MTWPTVWSILCYFIRYAYELLVGRYTRSKRIERFARVPLDFCYISFVFWGLILTTKEPASGFYRNLESAGLTEYSERATLLVIVLLLVLWGSIIRLEPIAHNILKQRRLTFTKSGAWDIATFSIYHLLGGGLLIISISYL